MTLFLSGELRYQTEKCAFFKMDTTELKKLEEKYYKEWEDAGIESTFRSPLGSLVRVQTKIKLYNKTYRLKLTHSAIKFGKNRGWILKLKSAI
jgi:phage terminase large subunit-like protein